MSQDLTVIVLAAGGGTRMKSKTMKVLHTVGGRSMIGHVLNAVEETEPGQVIVVVGTQREAVTAHVAATNPGVRFAVQETQDGTGHAVRVAMDALCAGLGGQVRGTVMVVTGDTPLLRGSSLAAFAAEHEAAERAVSILTGRVENPTGYGRIVRDDHGDVLAIVEEKDADPATRALDEINSGILAFDADFLAEALPRLRNDNNKQSEFYLTDTVKIAREDGLTVGAHLVADVSETNGVNDRLQLAAAGRELNARIVEGWMVNGVTVMDPATTWIEADVDLASDVTILPNTQLLGATTVATDAVIGPDTTLKDCEIGAGARVIRTHGELAVIGDRASVGPFAYLRPGTELGAEGKIGTFVETKNSTIGARSKVPHLSYVGDAQIGEGANIGAGTIFANYDGWAKNRTTVGNGAKTGSNNTFVAPVSIGDGAMTGGGTVVRKDVPPDALAVNVAPQRNLEGHAARKRAEHE